MTENRESYRAELVQQAVEGDGDALQRLLVHYHGPLSHFINKQMDDALRRHLDAEDILQNAYVEAYRSISICSFDGPGSFYRWIEKIALDRLLNASRDLRRQKRDIGRRFSRPKAVMTSCEDLLDRFAASGPTPSRVIAHHEASAAVLSSMARLTDEQRMVLNYRFLEGLPVAEIAAQMEKSEAAVHMLSYRGLISLRDILGSITRYMSGL